MAVEKAEAKGKPITCGLVMPISQIDGCSAEHWVEVKNIVSEAIEGIPEPQVNVKLVSDADDVGVIQKRIVQNIYSSDVIVCDVSGKNPNVMFELGMRLAFDKPTVIIKDDKTDYAFDTGIIEHIAYPRDLRFSKVVTFKTALAEKVLATYRAAASNPDHSTFLKNFGKFQVANLKESMVPADKMVLEMLGELQSEMARLRRTVRRNDSGSLRESKVVDAIGRIYQEIDAMRSEKPEITLRDLIGNGAFYEDLEGRIDAPSYFDGPRQFHETVDAVVRAKIRSSDRSD